ncbi:MAG: hypothetical protein ACWGPN_16055, partial [Gammaproteobacteria bacterium]
LWVATVMPGYDDRKVRPERHSARHELGLGLGVVRTLVRICESDWKLRECRRGIIFVGGAQRVQKLMGDDHLIA